MVCCVVVPLVEFSAPEQYDKLKLLKLAIYKLHWLFSVVVQLNDTFLPVNVSLLAGKDTVIFGALVSFTLDIPLLSKIVALPELPLIVALI